MSQLPVSQSSQRSPGEGSVAVQLPSSVIRSPGAVCASSNGSFADFETATFFAEMPGASDIPSESLLQVPVPSSLPMPSRSPSSPVDDLPQRAHTPTLVSVPFAPCTDTVFEPSRRASSTQAVLGGLVRRPRTHAAFAGASRGSVVNVPRHSDVQRRLLHQSEQHYLSNPPLLFQGVQRDRLRNVAPSYHPIGVPPLAPQGDGACGWSEDGASSRDSSRGPTSNAARSASAGQDEAPDIGNQAEAPDIGNQAGVAVGAPRSATDRQYEAPDIGTQAGSTVEAVRSDAGSQDEGPNSQSLAGSAVDMDDDVAIEARRQPLADLVSPVAPARASGVAGSLEAMEIPSEARRGSVETFSPSASEAQAHQILRSSGQAGSHQQVSSSRDRARSVPAPERESRTRFHPVPCLQHPVIRGAAQTSAAVPAGNSASEELGSPPEQVERTVSRHLSAPELTASWQVADELGQSGGMAAPRYLLVRLGECIPAETGAAPVHRSRLDSGPQWRDFLNFSDGSHPDGVALEEVLTCPCCLSIFRQPIGLPCGHSLCRGCYVRVSSQPSTARRCPLCRADLPRCDLRVNVALAAVSDALRSFHAVTRPRANHWLIE
eukprot:TRINITY_DN4075_c0_g1_i1.p1 TRINITY_DN4075_c0_g1~~TRINITY_DN4075_c0_g1_i1.p1  ORF type:complete len:604 (-),score=64.05 TRINITY_DN4075_c0_g1_i1:301-2112(-)